MIEQHSDSVKLCSVIVENHFLLLHLHSGLGVGGGKAPPPTLFSPQCSFCPVLIAHLITCLAPLLIIQVSDKFHGILNGIDFEEWDPATDSLLAANFTPAEPLGKELCKEFLQKV
jgi:hypothetical protein